MAHIHPRLRPPPIEIDADIRWVLLAAFAKPSPDGTRPASPERAVKLVEAFSLFNPVVSRLTPAQLFRALTPETEQRLSHELRRRVLRSLVVAQTRELVCAAANEAFIGIALLKQAALETLQLASPESRYATDVDILLHPKDLFLFSAALERRGLSLEKRKRHAHGVKVLRSAAGIGVELHTRITDVHLGDTAAVTFESLREHNLLQPRSPSEPHVTTPALEVIAAQIIVQGWYLFHYVPNAPGHKSPFRVLLDMQLLGLHENPDLAERTYRFISRNVPKNEYFGLISLVLRLSKFDPNNFGEHSRRLLSHAIASQLDHAYRRRLLFPRQLDAIRREGLLDYTRRQLTRVRRALRK